jgi:hypothetical protein
VSIKARYEINDIDDLPIWDTTRSLKDLPLSKVERWKVEERILPLEEWNQLEGFRCVFLDSHRGWTVCYQKPELSILIRLFHQDIRVLVSGKQQGSIDQEIELLRKAFPVIESADEEVPVEFVYGEQGMAVNRTRNIQAPTMQEILGNYNQESRQELERLSAADFRPDMDGGKLILWHGPPGAGKTYAVRALMREWKPWCHSWCVLDAESFFGDVSYMTDLLIDHIDDDKDKWRLLVIEDAGELMGVDAGMQAGQGLSRLLNLSDGILGQGLPIMILITTNQPLAQLHAAASRAGRCLSQQEFGLLDRSEAQQWLADQDSEQEVHQATSLADLYALLRGEEPTGSRDAGGFGFRA